MPPSAPALPAAHGVGAGYQTHELPAHVPRLRDGHRLRADQPTIHCALALALVASLSGRARVVTTPIAPFPGAEPRRRGNDAPALECECCPPEPREAHANRPQNRAGLSGQIREDLLRMPLRVCGWPDFCCAGRHSDSRLPIDLGGVVVYMYICVCVHTHTHTHTHRATFRPGTQTTFLRELRPALISCVATHRERRVLRKRVRHDRRIGNIITHKYDTYLSPSLPPSLSPSLPASLPLSISLNLSRSLSISLSLSLPLPHSLARAFYTFPPLFHVLSQTHTQTPPTHIHPTHRWIHRR